MASKKYTLLALFLCFMGGAFAQLAGILDYSDSSKVRAKKMAQQNEWANGLPGSPFPAKPRDAWQLGVFGGYAGVFGDVNTAPGWNAGLSLRKALGYVVSVRGSFSYGVVTGMAYENQFAIRNIPQPVRAQYQARGLSTFAPYYQTQVYNPSVDAIVSLNNIMFHRKQSSTNFYALIGYSPITYNTNLELLGSDNQPHDYQGVVFAQKRSEVVSALKNYYNGRHTGGSPDFETPALRRGRRNNFDDAASDRAQWRHAFNVGAGFERRLGDIVSISGEFKYTLPWNDDFVDGVVYTAGGTTQFTPNNDAFFFGNIGFNFNLGLKSRKKFLQQAGKDDGKAADLGQFPGKRVAPLWHHNPLGQPYGELANPTRMNMPKGWLEDSDGDGVPDQFDLEPNTPAGVPVDTRGRSRDTDGDGVPDYLDKELITPTYCQPVDADGIGKCPDPACCKDMVKVDPRPACNIGSLPSVQFASGRAALSTAANAILDAAASQILANPACKICVVGHGGGSKREQQLSWDRVNAVITYLVEQKGVSRDRFVFKYGEYGDANTVDLQDCTGESGPNMVPAPYPQYRVKK